MSVVWKKYGRKDTQAVKTRIGICTIWVFPLSGGDWAWQLAVGGMQLKADRAGSMEVAKARALGLLVNWSAGILEEATEGFLKARPL